jgi:hypothetical protein
VPLERLLLDGPSLKPRPEARKLIRAASLVPDIVQHGVNGSRRLIWDAITARGNDGRRHILSTPVQAELKRLARNGEWGDLSRTVISFFKYEQIRDQIEGRGRRAFLDVALWWPDRAARGKGQPLKRT